MSSVTAQNQAARMWKKCRRFCNILAIHKPKPACPCIVQPAERLANASAEQIGKKTPLALRRPRLSVLMTRIHVT